MAAKPPFENIKFTIIPLNETVEFPAYINTIASRFAPSWTDFPEIGRADAKVLLSSFAKDVDINFTVVAENDSDANVNKIFNKLQILSRATMPRYFSGNKGFQGNFIQFTIGNIYVDEIGYVNSLDYQWENDKTSWIDDLPMLTTVNMTIKWVGKKMPSDAISIFSHRT
jgi:hypothetical protein